MLVTKRDRHRVSSWRIRAAGSGLESVPLARETAPIDAQRLDVVLLPLLAFDARGNRLGTGGGFYDTTFSFLRDRKEGAKPLLVGIGYAFQQAESLSAENWDVALDYVATDRELIACSSNGQDGAAHA